MKRTTTSHHSSYSMISHHSLLFFVSDSSKVGLNEQQLLLSAEKGSLNGNYLQIVGADGLYDDKQALPKLIDSRCFDQQPEVFENKTDLKLKADDDSHDASSVPRDSDGENK